MKAQLTEEEAMKKNDRPLGWDPEDGPAGEQEKWDTRDESLPLKMEKRRHRDPEETDERRESERQHHPREGSRHRH